MVKKCAIKQLLLTIMVFLFIGCTTVDTRGYKVEEAQIKQIKIGQTTRAEVESILGHPDAKRNSRGKLILVYSQTRHEYRQTNPIPVPLVGVGTIIVTEALFGKSHMTNDHTEITIDANDRVSDIRRMSTDVNSSGLFVHDNSPKVDMSGFDKIQPGITTREQLISLLGGVPPHTSISLEANTRQMDMWICSIGSYKYLVVISRQDGIVDEVKKCFKTGQSFRTINTNSFAQLKEGQSIRETAESVLGHPSTVSCTEEGIFYTYNTKMKGIKEEIYIQYTDNDIINKLIRKPLPGK